MRESAVERAIRLHAESHGCIFMKLAPVAGSNGKPDRIILAPKGRLMLLEIKKPGEKLEPLQEWWQRRLRNLGYKCEWCDNIATGIQLVNSIL